MKKEMGRLISLIIVIMLILLIKYYIDYANQGEIWKNISEDLKNPKEFKDIYIYDLDTLDNINDGSIHIEKTNVLCVYDLDCADKLISYHEKGINIIDCDAFMIPVESELVKTNHKLIEYTKDSLLARVKVNYTTYTNLKYVNIQKKGYVYHKVIHEK